MDRDVRSKTPGKCPRCGMTLVAGIPQPVEYPIDLQVEPPRSPAAALSRSNSASPIPSLARR